MGTFDGLPQDATLALGGKQFQISYTGGDGNDVALTQMAGTITNSSPEIEIEFLPPDKVRLLWPTNFGSYFPTSTTNLTQPFAGGMGSPFVLGPDYVVTNTISDPIRFYRLETLGP